MEVLEPVKQSIDYILETKAVNLTPVLFRYVVPKPRSDCGKGEQLMVTFIAGYIAGVFCAIVSHPADSIVSKLNANPGGGVASAAKELGGYNHQLQGIFKINVSTIFY